MIETNRTQTADELHALIEQLDAATDAAEGRHAAATEALQFQLFLVERENAQNVLEGMPPDESLLRKRREIITEIDVQNERLEAMATKNNQERLLAQAKLNSPGESLDRQPYHDNLKSFFSLR